MVPPRSRGAAAPSALHLRPLLRPPTAPRFPAVRPAPAPPPQSKADSVDPTPLSARAQVWDKMGWTEVMRWGGNCGMGRQGGGSYTHMPAACSDEIWHMPYLIRVGCSGYAVARTPTYLPWGGTSCPQQAWCSNLRLHGTHSPLRLATGVRCLQTTWATPNKHVCRREGPA
jgi:hypothetical protein